MSIVLSWLKSKNLNAHATVAVILALAGLISGDPTVQTILANLFKNHPEQVTLIIAIAGVILRYSKSSTAASTVSQAQALVVASSPVTVVTSPVNPTN